MKLNPTDPDSLKEFFKKFDGLSNPELAILVNRRPDTIRDWRKKCNIPVKHDPFVEWRSKREKEIKTKIDCPEIWDNAEWFKEQYEDKGFGVSVISKIIRKNPKFTYYRLKKYGVKIRSPREATRSSNLCCNAEWLHYHYARREEYLKWCNKNKVETDEYGGMALPLRQCAELAGVVPYTILNWLARFKMRIRGITESSMLNRVVTDAQRRAYRDLRFEVYRKGKAIWWIGDTWFSNGIQMGKKQRVDKKKARVKKTSSRFKGP